MGVQARSFLPEPVSCCPALGFGAKVLLPSSCASLRNGTSLSKVWMEPGVVALTFCSSTLEQRQAVICLEG